MNGDNAVKVLLRRAHFDGDAKALHTRRARPVSVVANRCTAVCFAARRRTCSISSQPCVRAAKVNEAGRRRTEHRRAPCQPCEGQRRVRSANGRQAARRVRRRTPTTRRAPRAARGFAHLHKRRHFARRHRVIHLREASLRTPRGALRRSAFAFALNCMAQRTEYVRMAAAPNFICASRSVKPIVPIGG